MDHHSNENLNQNKLIMESVSPDIKFAILIKELIRVVHTRIQALMHSNPHNIAVLYHAHTHM